MHPTAKTARVAGAIYLVMAFTAPFSQLYVPAKIIARGDIATTAANLLAHETLFRIGIVADLATHTIFIALVFALYRLLARVDTFWAGIMVALVLVSATIGFVNVLTNIAALVLARGEQFLTAFNHEQLNALAMFFLRLHGQGNNVDELFWGLWLFPFGLLVMRSGFLPRFLGVWLLLNGVAYVVLSVTSIVEASLANRLFGFSMPLLFGELAIAFWLVIKGVKVEASPQLAGAMA